jgi:hypothetical protein
MFISLWSCRLIYSAVTGENLPVNKPFADAAFEAMRKVNDPKKFAKLVAAAEATKGDGETRMSYEEALAIVKAAL